MSRRIFREESLRRHRSAGRRDRTRLTIGTGTLVALWAVVALLAVVAAVFAAALYTRIGGVA
ncbi:hypothetical protein [Planobispora longispora]|uniref:Uncharacterized protein n=1 Tax=Planobispora longispora TaxID=28887 RepID=A0A8J3RHT4_9ACTN|nr:hypothetical protein [Planobispora longispora]GIH76631.1 hypothetical protein Plo01_30600 [Planobispora longispora]